MLFVTSVNYLKNYSLRVTFNDGTSKEVDLTRELNGEIFEPLKDKNYFRKVFLDKETRTIAWPNGADIAPEFLYGLDV